MANHNFKDLAGKRFSRLVVQSRAENNERGQARWNAKCDCGKEIAVSSARLLGGQQSCGCIRAEKNTERKFKDLTGLVFRHITVHGLISKDIKKGSLWLCKCECGKEIKLLASQVKRRHSCGCKTNEIISNSSRTHGKTNTHAYWLRKLAKKRASDRSLPFDLSIAFVEKLIEETTHCPYLGIELKTNKGKLSWNSATIDRIIPELGYTESNVMLISHRANTIKNDASPDEVMKIAIGMSRYCHLPHLVGQVGAT